MNYSQKRAFTLVELMVVISIIGVLSAIVYANFGTSRTGARDAERKSDLRNLQSAIEQYRLKKGTYPQAGCVAAGSMSSEKTCPVYIVGLVPEFIDRLPRDRNINGHEGYSYITNTAGTVYKVMALNTVEGETIDYRSEMKAYDIRDDSSSSGTDREKSGWCRKAYDSSNSVFDFYSEGSGVTRSNFAKSYGVWGGFASDSSGSAVTNTGAVKDTTDIICK